MAKNNVRNKNSIDIQLARITDKILDGSSKSIESENMDNSKEIKDLTQTISLLKNSFDINVLDKKTNAALKKKVKNEYISYSDKSNSSWLDKIFITSNIKQLLVAGAAIATIMLILPTISNSGENLPAAANQFFSYLPLLILLIIGLITLFWKNKS